MANTRTRAGALLDFVKLSKRIAQEVFSSKVYREYVRYVLAIDPKKTIGIYGDFTVCWPYIDYIAREVADSGFVALTSRYIYSKDENGDIQIKKTFQKGDPILIWSRKKLAEKDFIKILPILTKKSIFVESIPSSSFYETESAYDEKKEALGLVFVYKSFGAKNCRELLTRGLPNKIRYSVCHNSTGRCWEGFCPFLNIRKTIRDMYVRRNNMTLVALESLSAMELVIREFLDQLAVCNGKKKITTMRINEKLLLKAHDLSLNVSKVCENALKEMIRRIERPIR